jgi:predicted small secreted protein
MMKKSFLLVLLIVLSFLLIACTAQNKGEEVKQGDVREVIWSQLSSEDKERIDGTWKDGQVTKITLSEDMMQHIEDKSYAGKEVYLIDFPTKDITEPNNMIVYADLKTYRLIGYGLVD